MGMQNAKRKARNGRISGRGGQTKEAGTDVSWRNAASVQAGSWRQTWAAREARRGRDDGGRM
ncbi:hypothetical protein BDU57DRAFT_436414 [Ampelomyces quisqualis]|uniref:Uncharacterized protein n=1 Tax=Ampelomyces quisqualis TaxID=50730 RepID=A0A6A5R326_AMPQU|nr:hypothetical protein BDU57DRAFT_436414 [Ampelomyces quisqualis]